MQQGHQRVSTGQKRKVETRVMIGGDIVTVADFFDESIPDSEAVRQLRQRFYPQPTSLKEKDKAID